MVKRGSVLTYWCVPSDPLKVRQSGDPFCVCMCVRHCVCSRLQINESPNLKGRTSSTTWTGPGRTPNARKEGGEEQVVGEAVDVSFDRDQHL